MKKRVINFLLVAVMLFANIQSVFANNYSTEAQIKNIIYMIPDGGGMAPFYLADYVKQEGGLTDKFPNATPVEKGEMYIKQYLVGAETTHSASDAVTDSAAAGTALSSGYKTNNGYIGLTPEKKPRASILDLCQDMGKNTGLVATYEWTNGTTTCQRWVGQYSSGIIGGIGDGMTAAGTITADTLTLTDSAGIIYTLTLDNPITISNPS